MTYDPVTRTLTLGRKDCPICRRGAIQGIRPSAAACAGCGGEGRLPGQPARICVDCGGRGYWLDPSELLPCRACGGAFSGSARASFYDPAPQIVLADLVLRVERHSGERESAEPRRVLQRLSVSDDGRAWALTNDDVLSEARERLTSRVLAVDIVVRPTLDAMTATVIPGLVVILTPDGYTVERDVPDGDADVLDAPEPSRLLDERCDRTAGWTPESGDAEYDRQLGELIGRATTPPLDLVPAPTRHLSPEETEAYRASVFAAADRRKADEALLAERFGSTEQAIVALGTSVATRAERYAEVTAAEVREAWELGLATAHTRAQGRPDGDDAWQYLTDVEYGDDSETLIDLARLAHGYASALRDVRVMGGSLDLHPSTGSAAARVFSSAASVFPEDWIAASNKMSLATALRREGDRTVWIVSEPPLASISEVRAHYTDGKAKERPSADGHLVERVHAPRIVTNHSPGEKLLGVVHGESKSSSTAMHELAHRFESTVAGLCRVSRDFTTRRATLPDGTLAPLAPIYHGVPDEVARDGGYVDPYVGREYPSGRTEVLSAGVEALFGGGYGGLVGVGGFAPDLDHRAFVLGCLAGLGLRRRDRRDTRGVPRPEPTAGRTTPGAYEGEPPF